MTPIPAVPTLHDLVMIFERASKEADPSDSYAGDPGKWPVVRGVSAVAQALARIPEQGEIAAPAVPTAAAFMWLWDFRQNWPNDGSAPDFSQMRDAFKNGMDPWEAAAAISEGRYVTAAPHPEAGEPCPTCGGEGENICGNDCSECNGTGRTSPAPAGDTAPAATDEAVERKLHQFTGNAPGVQGADNCQHREADGSMCGRWNDEPQTALCRDRLTATEAVERLRASMNHSLQTLFGMETAAIVSRAVEADLRAEAAEAQVRELRKEAEQLVAAAENIPSLTPAPGGAGTIHRFEISAGAIWELAYAKERTRSALTHTEPKGETR